MRQDLRSAAARSASPQDRTADRGPRTSGSPARIAGRPPHVLVGIPQETVASSVGLPEVWHAREKDVWQGTLALMVLRTLDVLGPQHGYGIAKRIEQVSADMLVVNHGTLYPVLLKLEQEGRSLRNGASPKTTGERSSSITTTGRAELETERRHWERTGEIIARFFALNGESL